MRITCTLPGYEQCYVEVSDRWTRGEIRRFWSGGLTGDDDASALLIQKTEAVYLVTVDGLDLDDPSDLTDENLDQLAYEMFVWLSNAYGHAVNELQTLTKKNVQDSLRTIEGTK